MNDEDEGVNYYFVGIMYKYNVPVHMCRNRD